MNKPTEIVFVLDKSGSMFGLEAETVKGFNSMIQKQKELDAPCQVTTVLFNNQMSLLYDGTDLNEVKPMKVQNFEVGGSTALLDALGLTIKKMKKRLKEETGSQDSKQVLFVIITDGEENSSHLFSLDKIKKMIDKQQKKHGWEFIFLGANIDAAKAASQIGIEADHAADYSADEEGTMLNFEAMSQAAASFRCESAIPQAPLNAVRENAARKRRK